MRPLLGNPAFIEHDDAVRCTNGRQAVRYDQRRAIFHQFNERLLNQLFAFGVQRAGRFSKQ